MNRKEYFQHETALVSPRAAIGGKTRIWAFVNIQDDAVIGEGCNICDHCFIEKGSSIGNHVTVKNGVAVFEGVTLEDDVFCGANVSFINDRFPRSHRDDPWTLEKTLVRKGATIGSNATILCGLTVGKYAFVGAGAVVVDDVPDYTLVFGSPAKRRGYVCCCGKKLPEDLKCLCGKEYTSTEEGLRLKSR